MVSFTSATLFALAYVSCLVNARPLAGRDNLDVAAPPVTYPTQGVVWKAGEKQTVTWDTSNLPVHITNPIGKVVLGWMDDNGLNLQLNTPIVDGFPITAGKVDLVVPSQYPDRDTYIIALIGSSGNISPTFTITGGSSSSDNVDPNPSTTTTTPQPVVQPSSTHGSPPSTTPGSDSSLAYNVVSPSPPPSTSSPTVSPMSSSSKSGSSPSPSGTSAGSSSGSSNDTGSAWSNKPASTMFISLLAGCLVTLFL